MNVVNAARGVTLGSRSRQLHGQVAYFIARLVPLPRQPFERVGGFVAFRKCSPMRIAFS